MRTLVMMGEQRTARENPIWAAAAEEAKRRHGAEVVIGFAEDRTWHPESMVKEFDLFIHKSRSPIWFSITAGVSVFGARIENPLSATTRACNKFETSTFLSAKGFQVPPSWMPGKPQVSPPGRGDFYMVKQIWGHRGQGVRRIGREQFSAEKIQPREEFVQEWVSGRELKVKVLAEHVAVFARRPCQDNYVVGDPVTLSEELRAVARHVGALLELSMFGIDVIENDEGLHIIDVNLVPSYRQFPYWVEPLAALLSGKSEGPNREDTYPNE